MTGQRLMWILWPSFLFACLLEALVFVVVDPGDLRWPGLLLDWPPQATYSLAFFIFWIATASSSALSLFLAFGTAEPPE